MRAWICGDVVAAQWHQGLHAGPDRVAAGVGLADADRHGQCAVGQNGSSGSNAGGAWCGMSCSRQACCIWGP